MQYNGEMKDNKPHGQGTRRWANGSWYEGSFADGAMHGEGRYFWAVDSKKIEAVKAGDMFEGAHHQGKTHGKGKRYTRSGEVFLEEWHDGVILESVLAESESVPDHHKAALEALEAQETEEKNAGISPQERAKMQALLGAGTTNQQTKLVVGESDVTLELTKESMANTATVIIKDCNNCDILVQSTCTKVLMNGCKNCRLTLNGKVITSVVELYECNDATVEANTPVKTLQIDMCNTVNLSVPNGDTNFQSVVWAGTEDFNAKVNSKIHGELSLSSGFEAVCKEYGNISPEAKEREQFIVRVVSGKLLQERVIRLANGFPSTVRENKEFERVNRQKLAAFAADAGISIGRPKNSAVHVGRNDPCPCGSKKKFKKCCGVGGD